MPQVYQVSEIARPAYYDRQPISQIPNYNGIVGPHGTTVRVSYSPAFRLAYFIESSLAQVQRITAASAMDVAQTAVIYNPFQGGSIQISAAILYNNAVRALIQQQLTQFGYMAYGDTISITTFDLSTGGTCQFLGFIKGTEFVY